MSIIYLIECKRDYETVYKIGFSKKPNMRSDSLQTGNDGNLRVIESFNSSHGRRVESALHRFYSHRHIEREWFRLDLEDVQKFNTLCHKIEKNLTLIERSRNLL